MSAPFIYRYEGEGMFQALTNFIKRCDEAFVIGERYRLSEIEERSIVSHNHEFASLAEAWKQLPEDLMELYPTVEHLRKRALIDAGWYDETIIDAGSNAAALRVASAIRARSGFAVVIVRGPLVVIRDAKSQSCRAMGKKDFQASKQAVLEIAWGLVGLTPEEAAPHVARAA